VKQIGFLEGPQGEKSSKRLWGSVLIGIGTLIGIASSIYALFYALGDADYLTSIVELFISYGCLLELGGLGDNFGIVKQIGLQSKIGFLEGPHGEKSSKRLWGSVLIGIATLIGIGSSLYALFYALGAADYLKRIFELFISCGCLLELGGLGDNFLKKK
jgi:hypothetical protein